MRRKRRKAAPMRVGNILPHRLMGRQRWDGAMAHPFRALAFPLAAAVAAALLAPSAAAGPLAASGCPVGPEPILVPRPNPDGSVHFTVGVKLHWEQDGTCHSLKFDQTFLVPWTAPCEVAADADPNGDGSHHYRAGASVGSTGVNGGQCRGHFVEGDTPPLPEPPEPCDELGPEPILVPRPNPDGSVHFTVGVILHWQDAGGCRSLKFDQTFLVPWTAPCEVAAEAEPNGDGTYHYRVGATASSTGLNNGSCTGRIQEGNTPPVP
jgi:hypothetical protein